MISKSNGLYKKPYILSSNYYKKLLNRIIVVLIILLTILVIKVINSKTTNNIIEIIEKNIYYDFTLKRDGIVVKDYVMDAINNSKDTIYQIADEVIKKTK